MPLTEVSPKAVVETSQIGPATVIREYAVIRHDVVVGANVSIHPHVVIEDGVTIGNGVEIFPGTYIGKRPNGAGATARPFSPKARVLIGDNCALGPNATIFYDVQVGNNTLLGDGASLREQVRVGSYSLLGRYVTVNYNTTIGDRTKIMDLTYITGNCRIGNDVFVGILVCTTNDNSLVTREYREEDIEGPIVADRATIGSGAILLPSIHVGEGAFVGAGAVVTKDVQPMTLVAGVPARFVRRVFPG